MAKDANHSYLSRVYLIRPPDEVWVPTFGRVLLARHLPLRNTVVRMDERPRIIHEVPAYLKPQGRPAVTLFGLVGQSCALEALRVGLGGPSVRNRAQQSGGARLHAREAAIEGPTSSVAS